MTSYYFLADRLALDSFKLGPAEASIRIFCLSQIGSAGEKKHLHVFHLSRNLGVGVYLGTLLCFFVFVIDSHDRMI